MSLERPDGWRGIDQGQLPPSVRRILGTSPPAVWHNGIGGVTYALTGAFCKVGPLHREWDPQEEARRMAWIGRWLPAPHVLSAGVEDGVGWLHTRALPGRSAIALSADIAVPALGRALRAFHDALPVAECLWTWAPQDRIAELSGDHGDLRTPPPVDRLVVCHGDACNPTFLLDDDGTCTGYVDLTRVGIADRWADLAPAVLSLGWNFGPGHEQTFLNAYGVGVDARLAWYQRLWQAE